MSAVRDEKAWEEAKKKFHVGAKVKLNSGGPTMSVMQHHDGIVSI